MHGQSHGTLVKMYSQVKKDSCNIIIRIMPTNTMFCFEISADPEYNYRI